MPNLATYRKALAERSSYVENVLIHRLVAGLAGELWQHDPGRPLNIFNPEVDDVGFDLVLGCDGLLWYIQIKQVHLKGSVRKFSVRLDFASLPGSCVIVVVHSDTDLSVDHYLFFGDAAGKPMPNVVGEKASSKNKDGTRKIRQHYRDIPRQRFSGPLNIRELLGVLFSIGPVSLRRRSA